ncbi:hypothetical protein CLA01_37130 [Chryseobacterium lathyri]|uniref:Uncharacterized protein n=1 Tax=Chryseobacterium lathyri TaxID=395933 RepID=A0A511YEM5_9FLAO|nr:hypothetical protein CLA01_37130 [Chryseobacterium lathyri]
METDPSSAFSIWGSADQQRNRTEFYTGFRSGTVGYKIILLKNSLKNYLISGNFFYLYYIRVNQLLKNKDGCNFLRFQGTPENGIQNIQF